MFVENLIFAVIAVGCVLFSVGVLAAGGSEDPQEAAQN